MSVINTNTKSLIAQAALDKNNRVLSSTMEQLSTGKRINGAKDDAAGLSIVSKMTSQIRGLDQAVRNANDGISLLQTADGAMVEVTNMLQRMRELGVQSANDSNTGENRGYLDLEFQQLKGEIDRIITNTQWNGVNVLDGSYTNNGTGTTQAGKFVFQIGANSGQTISHQIDVFNLGSADGNTTTTTVAEIAATGTPTTVEVSTLTVGGTYAEGDIITVNLNQNLYSYTVTSADAGSSATLSTNLATALNSRFDDGFAITQSGAGVVKFTLDTNTGTTTGNTFTLTASATDGEWDSLETLKIDTQSNSNTAINTLDVALTNVNKARAEIGAVINRLNYAVDNLTNVSTNTQASRSRIEDTDYAEATTKLARAQIIQQAATAMLAQANQQPQSVLSLLK